jgi:hypothetical protein
MKMCTVINNLFAITGIPQHLSILTEMNGIVDEVCKVVSQIKSVVPDVVNGVTALLEVQAIATGTINTFGHKETIKTVMGDILGKASVPEVLEYARIHDQDSHFQLTVHRLFERPIFAPEFAFPNRPPLSLWQLKHFL